MPCTDYSTALAQILSGSLGDGARTSLLHEAPSSSSSSSAWLFIGLCIRIIVHVFLVFELCHFDLIKSDAVRYMG